MTLKLITSMASRALLKELLHQYQLATSRSVYLEAAGGVDVAKRVRGGEALDLVVLARNSIEDLAGAGLLMADSITDIATSGIAVAVQIGAAACEISSEQAVREAVLRAATLSYSTGPSGVYLENKFAAWGILEQIRPRIVVPPPGVPVGSLIAAGKVALGFQQLSELINLQGIKVLGPLPPPMQLLTTFSGAAVRQSEKLPAAREVLNYFSSPEAAEIKPRFGMQHANSTVPG